MEATALSYQIRKLMFHDQKYSHDGMYALYLQVMAIDEFIDEDEMLDESLYRLLRAWISLDGTWLIKEGTGKKAVYFKREPEDWILKLINRSRDFGRRISDKVRRIISKAP